jgi:hypothetical protein
MSTDVASTKDLVGSLIDNAGKNVDSNADKNVINATEEPPAESASSSHDGSTTTEEEEPSPPPEETTETVPVDTIIPTQAPNATGIPSLDQVDVKANGNQNKSGSSLAVSLSIAVGALLLVVVSLYSYRVWKRKRYLSRMGEEFNAPKSPTPQNSHYQRNRNNATNISSRSSLPNGENVGPLSFASTASRSASSIFQTSGFISPGSSLNTLSCEYQVPGSRQSSNSLSVIYEKMITSPPQTELNSIPKPVPEFPVASTQSNSQSVLFVENSHDQLQLPQSIENPSPILNNNGYDKNPADLFIQENGLNIYMEDESTTMFQIPVINESEKQHDMHLERQSVEVSNFHSDQFYSPVSAFPGSTMDDIEATISILPDKYPSMIRDTMNQAEYFQNQNSYNVADFTMEGRPTAISNISDYIVYDQRSTCASSTTEFTIDERNTAASMISKSFALEEGSGSSSTFGNVVYHGDQANSDRDLPR